MRYVMIKPVAKTKKQVKRTETDTAYFLKLVLYLILGSQWVFLVDAGLTRQIPIPFGLIIGLLFTRQEHFQIDRKIEYAVLLVAMIVGFWRLIGLTVTIL